MRETLFIGKRKDNNEWIEGDLIHRQIWRSKIVVIRVSDDGFDNYEEYEVVPETVRQFTNLTDRNRKRIFEGSILRGFCYPFQDGEGNYNYYAEVVWFKNSPAFGLVTHKNPESNVVGISDGNCEYIEDWDPTQWEIIGNIYDNKELLDGKDKG